MNYRTIFWATAFTLPVVLAISISISLQREHAALEAEIGRLTASSIQIQSSLQESTKQRQAAEQESNAKEADLKELESTLSPWQKRAKAVVETAARLAAEGGSKEQGATLPFDELSYFPQLLGDPKYSAAVAALANQDVEGKYGRLFSALNLSPAAQGQLKNLLAQRQMAKEDAKGLITGGSSPINPTAPVSNLAKAEAAAASSETVKAINKDIRTTFGLPVSRAISAYDGIAQFYDATDKMTTRLSYTPTPLQPAQADQVVGLLAQALGPKVYTSYWAVPPSVVKQAATVLSSPQVAVLKQIQEEQMARLQARNSRQAAATKP